MARRNRKNARKSRHARATRDEQEDELSAQNWIDNPKIARGFVASVLVFIMGLSEVYSNGFGATSYLRNYTQIMAKDDSRRASHIMDNLNNNKSDTNSSSSLMTTMGNIDPVPLYVQFNVTLSNESLEHIARTGMYDLTFVNVTNDYKDHPHQGAVDENGLHGYIHDVTHLRKNPIPLGWNETTFQANCAQNNISVDQYHWPALERLRVYNERTTQKDNNNPKLRPSKILCGVYTSSHLRAGLDKIRETWGPKCDGFFAGSNLTDKVLDTVNVLHMYDENYQNMWQKVRSIWSYMYDHYYDDYDWFHLGCVYNFDWS